MERDSLVQNILNTGCALNNVPKRCRFEGCFNPVWRGTDTCTKCMEEMHPPEYEPEDSEDMPECELREKKH